MRLKRLRNIFLIFSEAVASRTRKKSPSGPGSAQIDPQHLIPRIASVREPDDATAGESDQQEPLENQASTKYESSENAETVMVGSAVVPCRNLPLAATCMDPKNDFRLWEIRGVLTAEECDAVIKAVQSQKWCRSTIHSQGGVGVVSPARTSFTCWLNSGRSDIVGAAIAKIRQAGATLSGVDIEACKPTSLQVVRYEVGQEFQAHTDHANRATLLIYLNDAGVEGGETHFPYLEKKVAVETGKALFWYTLPALEGGGGGGSSKERGGQRSSMHAGLPLLAGTKYICTQWFTPPVLDVPSQ